MSESSDIGNNGPGQIIASSRPIRMAIFVVSNFLIAACAVFSVVWILIICLGIGINSITSIQFQINYEPIPNLNVSSNLTDIPLSTYPQSQPIETAPVYLFCCALTLAAISAFLKAGFVFKFVAMMICIGVQGAILWSSNLFRDYNNHR